MIEQNPKRQIYQSYLIRCWTNPAPESGGPAQQRFIVETVSNTPQRQGFDSLAGLLAFLQVELEAEACNQQP